MKPIILLSIFALPNIAKAQLSTTNTFDLTGEVVGQDTGYIHLNYVNSSAKYIQDIFPLKNGKFEFFGSISEPTYAFLFLNMESINPEAPNYTRMFLEPTKMHATFKKNELKHGNITGSNTENE
jgi:hypothetical protein